MSEISELSAAATQAGSTDHLNVESFKVRDYIRGAIRTLLAQVEKIEQAAPWILSLGM
jgi:hypothetical protein